jgi:putative membrane protein
MSTPLFSPPREDTAPSRSVFAAIGAVSFVAVAFLIWLIYVRGGAKAPEWVSSLPAVNAALNFMSAVCLLAGYLRIRRREITAHKRFMLAATCFSGLFLVSYVTYHFFHGDSIFPGHGAVRTAYLGVLASHILLSMVALPLILATLYFALGARFQFHRKVARWTFPIWMYVSVTGVLVFLLLRAYSN